MKCSASLNITGEGIRALDHAVIAKQSKICSYIIGMCYYIFSPLNYFCLLKRQANVMTFFCSQHPTPSMQLAKTHSPFMNFFWSFLHLLQQTTCQHTSFSSIIFIFKEVIGYFSLKSLRRLWFNWYVQQVYQVSSIQNYFCLFLNRLCSRQLCHTVPVGHSQVL